MKKIYKQGVNAFQDGMKENTLALLKFSSQNDA